MLDQEREGRREAIRKMVHGLAGDLDVGGVELMARVRMIANQYDAVVDSQLRASDLSGPRWDLLFRLMAEEQDESSDGISPTHLSRCQNVSKNTISALLRGLEDQGLVERALDPADRRAFHIRLTEAGRVLVHTTVPEHLAFLNTLAADLTPEDRDQLLALLDRLHRSIVQRIGDSRPGASPIEDPGRELAPARA